MYTCKYCLDRIGKKPYTLCLQDVDRDTKNNYCFWQRPTLVGKCINILNHIKLFFTKSDPAYLNVLCRTCKRNNDPFPFVQCINEIYSLVARDISAFHSKYGLSDESFIEMHSYHKTECIDYIPTRKHKIYVILKRTFKLFRIY